jgi:DNA-directed RNA polymerase sigma subunit (sigma70/sigma32)
MKTGHPELEQLCRLLARECGGVLETDDFLQVLKEDEIRILYCRFVEGRSLVETGQVVRNKANTDRANRERIRQREYNAIRKLRSYIARDYLTSHDELKAKMRQRLADSQRQTP